MADTEERAGTATQGGGRTTGLLVALVLGRVAFGYEWQTVASLGPLLVQTFGIDYARLGTLVGLYLLPGVALALPCGFLARRQGDKVVLCTGLALMAAGSLLSAVAAGPFGLGVGRVLAGGGSVGLTVLQAKIAADRFRGRALNLAMGLLVGSFPIGVGLGQLTHASLARAFGWPAAFVAGAIPAALGAALALATFGPSRGTGAGPLRWPSPKERFLVIVAGLMWTFYNAGFANFLAYMPSYLAGRGHPKIVADLVITIGTWANLPSLLLGSAAISRFGMRPVMAFGAAMGVISIGGAGIVDWPLVWGVLFGTLASAHAGAIIALGTMSARPENRAVGMGLFFTTYFVGGGISPFVCGAAADLYGDPRGAFLCAAALSSLVLPLFLLHQARGSRAA